jgi:UDP-2-acetamido-3-amino-2,3-dideoxy-glucuronate N-acetyltransferase
MPINDVIGMRCGLCYHFDLVNLYGCRIDVGTTIGAFVEIGEGVQVGKNCKIQTGAFLPPGVVIGDRVFIGPHAVFCNVRHPMRGEPILSTVVEDDAVIGANATILPGITIGKGAFVGAGAVVTRDVAPGVTVVGNPARVQKPQPDPYADGGIYGKTAFDLRPRAVTPGTLPVGGVSAKIGSVTPASGAAGWQGQRLGAVSPATGGPAFDLRVRSMDPLVRGTFDPDQGGEWWKNQGFDSVGRAWKKSWKAITKLLK